MPLRVHKLGVNIGPGGTENQPVWCIKWVGWQTFYPISSCFGTDTI